MEFRVLKPQEKPLFSDLYIKDCFQVSVSNSFDENHSLIYGCFDKELVACLVVDELSRIEHIRINKECCIDYIIKKFIDFIKMVCIDKINLTIKLEYYKYFKDEDFSIVESTDEYIALNYTRCINSKFTNFEEVYNYISSQKNRVYSLANFKNFMKDFGDIQHHLACIHIGGTNGKGSTTNYVRSVLQKENYKVATFTSPALYSRLDVIRINNEPILEKEYVLYANCFIDLWNKYQLSMFEIEVFIAIVHFIKHQTDFAVFEVGLGGELDATNIIYPFISAITNIGLDHIEYLGDTYEKIAKTKAGIIKKGSAFITTETKESCLDIFKDICHKLNVKYIEIDEINNLYEDSHRIEYDYKDYHVHLNTSASYQSKNSVLALEILRYLRDNDIIHLSDYSLLSGLKDALWQGRFETICENPLIIIDGAHNKEGVEAFFHSAKKYNNIKIIFSALKDKDTHAMIERLLDLTDDVTVCEFDFYRAQSAEVLADDFPVKVQKDWKKAVDDAFLHKGVTFVTGSLYFISQVRPYILNKQKFK